jgi:putative transcriptional regulator
MTKIGFTAGAEPQDDNPAIEPDPPPMTEAQLKAARRVPRVTTLRRALRLTQEEFSQKFLIPLGTLRDWEQGRSEPDAPARAYLHAIAGNPAAVAAALIRSPPPR